MKFNQSGIEQWEKYADLYHKGKGLLGDDLHHKCMQPILDQLVDDYSDKIILDAGCGNGFLSKIFSQKAKKVVGMDFSDKLLEHARTNFRATNLFFEKGNLMEKFPFRKDSFDIVVAMKVIEYLPELENFASEISRVLKKNGRLAIVTDHPCHALFLRAQELAGKTNERLITTGSYFKISMRKKRSLWDKAILSYYHRTVGEILNRFSKYLVLDKFIEHTLDGEMPRMLGCLFINKK